MTTTDIKQALAAVRSSGLVDASEGVLNQRDSRKRIGRAWLCEAVESMIERRQFDAAYWTVRDMIDRDAYIGNFGGAPRQFIDDLHALEHLLDGAREGFCA